MDHLPKPAQAIDPGITVPLLAYTPYDFKGLYEFGSRNGFVKDGSLVKSHTGAQLAAFIQSWLYFGLLSELFGRLVGPADFESASDVETLSSRTLNSEQMPQLFDQWQADLRRMGPKACKKQLAVVRQTIDIALDLSTMCEHVEPVGSTVYATVMLSVKLLNISVIHIHNAIAPSDHISTRDARLFPLRSSFSQPTSAVRLLQSYMTDAGMCPRAIDRICRSYNYLTALYLLQLPRLRTEDHSACLQSRCVAYDTDQVGYKSRHTTADCQCSHWAVDRERIRSIVASGDFPLIMLEKDGDQELKMHIKASTYEDIETYIALSHVWRDGLGNAAANSLPRCQMQRLHTKVRLYPGPRSSWFWIDTLCIPVDDETGALRQQAIASMASVYQGASCVLVIDAGLETIDISLSDADFMAQILGSPWNSRCWTYQEAVLGEQLLFLVRGGRRVIGLESDFDIHVTPWNTWWWYHAPASAFAKLRIALQLMPLDELFTTSFALACGPQAWYMVTGRKARRSNQPGGPSADLRGGRVLGSLWLLAAFAFVAFSLPGSAALICIAWLVILCCTLWDFYIGIARGSKVDSSSDILNQGTRRQLFDDIRSELTMPRERGPTAIFVQTWNALALRSTTKEDDLILVLSCLTNLVPYRIAPLRGPARMRAVVGSHQALPLALLFDPQLQQDGGRDPENAWLPRAPTSHILPTDADEPLFHLWDAEIRIPVDELGPAYTLLADHPDMLNETHLTTEGSAIYHNDTGGEDASSLVASYYLIRNSKRSTLETRSSKTVEAVRFAVKRWHDNDAFCVFKGVVDVSAVHSRLIRPTALASIRLQFCGFSPLYVSE